MLISDIFEAKYSELSQAQYVWSKRGSSVNKSIEQKKDGELRKRTKLVIKDKEIDE